MNKPDHPIVKEAFALEWNLITYRNRMDGDIDLGDLAYYYASVNGLRKRQTTTLHRCIQETIRDNN